jgi:hypothetical protein
MPTRHRRKLSAAIAATVGASGMLGGARQAVSDSLTGTYTDASGLMTQTGSSVSETSAVTYLSLGQEVGASFVGDIGTGVMSATAAAGNNGTSGAGSSLIVYSATVTNTGPTAQALVFNLNISDSQLLAVNQYTAPNGAGTAAASIEAAVTVNGVSVFTSSATLSTTNNFSNTYTNTNPYTYSSAGAAFAGATIQNVYPGSGSFAGTSYESVSFGPFTDSISLGTLASGHSETISYELSATTQLSGISGGGFDGYGGAVATIGDPLSVAGSPSFAVSAVPEPETYELMAAGLALVGSLTRRRRKAE